MRAIWIDVYYDLCIDTVSIAIGLYGILKYMVILKISSSLLALSSNSFPK